MKDKKKEHLYHSRTFLHEEYILKDKTAHTIADTCNVKVSTIYYWLCKFQLFKEEEI